jgi:hypothetical protein
MLAATGYRAANTGKDAGSNTRSDSECSQLDGAERSFELSTRLSRVTQKLVQRFAAEKGHWEGVQYLVFSAQSRGRYVPLIKAKRPETES